MFQVFPMFQRYVASISYRYYKSRSGCCICCKCFIGMSQAFVQSVSSVSDACYKHFDLDVSYVPHIYCKSMFQMFQLFHSYIAVSIFMLQVFYLNVAYVFTHMLQVYVSNISFASDLYCIQMFHIASVSCFRCIFSESWGHCLSAVGRGAVSRGLADGAHSAPRVL
jgi:hypothetical protein